MLTSKVWLSNPSVRLPIEMNGITEYFTIAVCLMSILSKSNHSCNGLQRFPYRLSHTITAPHIAGSGGGGGGGGDGGGSGGGDGRPAQAILPSCRVSSHSTTVSSLGGSPKNRRQTFEPGAVSIAEPFGAPNG